MRPMFSQSNIAGHNRVRAVTELIYFSSKTSPTLNLIPECKTVSLSEILADKIISKYAGDSFTVGFSVGTVCCVVWQNYGSSHAVVWFV